MNDFFGAYAFGTPALAWPEQRKLISAAQGGDRDAEDRLVRSYVGMVLREANRWQRKSDDADELAQVGLIAVAHAVRRFRLGERNRLSTVVMAYLRNAFLRFRQEQLVVRVPQPSFLPTAPEHIAAARDRAMQCASIDAVAQATGGLAEALADERQREPADELSRREDEAARRRKIARLDAAIDRLSPRLRHVLRGRLVGMTLKEVAASIGVSKERVRQLERDARHELRERLMAGGFKREP